MAIDREAAREAGYTDEEIDAFLQSNPAARRREQQRPAEPTATEPPPPTTVVPTIEASPSAVATTGIMAAAPYLAPAAVGAAGLYGANLARQGINAMRENAAARAAAEQGIQQRFEQRMGQQAAQAARPVAPATPQILGPSGQPLPPSGPVAPQGMPPQAATAMRGAQAAEAVAGPNNWMQQALNMARQYAPSVARAGVGLAALAPTSTGPAVPSTGRMRGMEINPLTGQGWTREQIAQYEANPDLYDRQLPPAQFRR